MLDEKSRKVHMHFTFPEYIKEELELNVEERKRSLFVAEATMKELIRLKMKKAIDAGFGAWKAEDHKDLKNSEDIYKYVRRLREESEERLKEGND